MCGKGCVSELLLKNLVIPTLVVPLTCCVRSRKWPNLSVPQFPLQWGSTRTHLIVLWELNETEEMFVTASGTQ